MLIGQFWGTGAAEGIPAPFCRCRTCQTARREGGNHMRLRSCFRLSDEIMVDLGADSVVQSLRYGDLSRVNHVLITHTHDDHLNPHMLMEAMWSARFRKTLHYYFTDQAFDIVDHWRSSPWILKGKVPEWERKGYVAFHPLHFMERTPIGEIEVIPFRGNHRGNVGESSALYLIFLPDGRTLFYGLDSGPYFPETLEALRDYKIDILISEATFGLAPSRPHKAHMNMAEVRSLVERLLQQGTLTPQSLLYLTHINHNNGATPEHLQQALQAQPFPVPTEIAYDGLRIL